MSYSAFLRRFGPVATLIAIRAATGEDYRPARSAVLVSDPWWSVDFDYRTAYAYEPKAVAW